MLLTAAHGSIQRRVAKDVCVFCMTRQFHASQFAQKKAPSIYNAAKGTRDKYWKGQPDRVREEKEPWHERVRAGNFVAAHRHGYFKCELEVVEKIYQEILTKGNIRGEDVKKLAAKHDVPVMVITSIGALILRQRHSEEFLRIASRILSACSEAKEPNATISLVRTAFRRKLLKHSHFSHARSHLTQLAREKNSRAMVLQAQILEQEGRPLEALKLYEGAVDAMDAAQQDLELDEQKLDEVMRSTDVDAQFVGDAYAALGDLYGNQYGDFGKAREAYRRGAFEADDPEAYHMLAESEFLDTEANPNELITGNWIQYQTKAAASGHQAAMLELAKFYAMSEEEAKKRMHPDALRVFERAAQKRMSSSKSLPFFVATTTTPFQLIEQARPRDSPSITDKTSLREACTWAWNQTFGYHRRRMKELTRMAWALEWYMLAVTPPPCEPDGILDFVKLLHRAGDHDAALHLAKGMLPESNITTFSHYSKTFDHQRLARLRMYAETRDIRSLEAPLDEIVPKANQAVRKERPADTKPKSGVRRLQR